MALRLLRLVPASAASRGLAAVVPRVVSLRRAGAAGATCLVFLAPPLPHLPGPPRAPPGGGSHCPLKCLVVRCEDRDWRGRQLLQAIFSQLQVESGARR